MRVIDADAFLKDILTAGIGKTIIEYSESDIGYMIRRRPTIDAVPVVRCKDCKKRGTPDCAMWYQCSVCEGQWSWETNEGFCSYGERKEGAD